LSLKKGQLFRSLHHNNICTKIVPKKNKKYLHQEYITLTFKKKKLYLLLSNSPFENGFLIRSMIAHVPVTIGLWNLGMTIKLVHADTRLNSSRFDWFSPLTEFWFSPISKYRYGEGNRDIDTHFKPVPNVEIYKYLTCKSLNIMHTFEIFLNF